MMCSKSWWSITKIQKWKPSSDTSMRHFSSQFCLECLLKRVKSWQRKKFLMARSINAWRSCISLSRLSRRTKTQNSWSGTSMTSFQRKLSSSFEANLQTLLQICAISSCSTWFWWKKRPACRCQFCNRTSRKSSERKCLCRWMLSETKRTVRSWTRW